MARPPLPLGTPGSIARVPAVSWLLDAVDLFRERDRPVAQLAAELGISESCLRRWAAQDDVDTGRVDGVSSDERSELAQLRRDKRRLEMENEILRRAAAYFARENVLPK